MLINVRTLVITAVIPGKSKEENLDDLKACVKDGTNNFETTLTVTNASDVSKLLGESLVEMIFISKE